MRPLKPGEEKKELRFSHVFSDNFALAHFRMKEQGGRTKLYYILYHTLRPFVKKNLCQIVKSSSRSSSINPTVEFYISKSTTRAKLK